MRPVVYIACLVGLIPQFATATKAEEHIRIASYNIFFLTADIPEERAQRLRTVVDRLDANIIGLQEIADRLALERVFDPEIWQLVIDDDSDDSQDVALAVKKPLKVVDLNDDPNDLDADDDDFLFSRSQDNRFFPNRRDVLSVRVQLPNGAGDLYVLVLHPKARRGGRNTTDARREGAARMLLQKLEHDFDGRRYSVIGDFNDNPDDTSLNILEAGDPNALGGPEQIDGPFLANLAEEALANDHVSWGLRARDARNSVVNTVKRGSRARNNDERGHSGSVSPILFDQILIPVSMRANYIEGSFAVFNDPATVEGGHPNSGGASDHVPVLADFVFDSTEATESEAVPTVTASTSIRIVAALPNPVGVDAGNEWVKLRNSGTNIVNLENWRLRDRANNVFQLSGEIRGGAEIQVNLTANSMPLNNDGDLLLLFDGTGQEVDRAEYGSDSAQAGTVVEFGED